MNEISLCMICRNEATQLPEALDNLDSFADELIVADNGSQDNTTNVAEQLGAKVIDVPFVAPGHKGEARNATLDAASGDWIVVLDADERIQNPGAIRHLLSTPESQYDLINVRFQNYDSFGNVSLDWYQPRIFRRGQFHYVHREHELPVPVNGDEYSLGSYDVIFEHYPPPERTAPKVDAMLQRLELDVAERPDDLHPLYFLARQYVTANQYDKAIEAGLRYVNRAKHHLSMQYRLSDAYQHLSMAYEGANRIEEAFEYQYLAICHEPHRRAFWLRLASMMRHFRQDHALALVYLQAGLQVEPRGRENQPADDQRLLAMWNHSQQELLNHVHS